jgi:intein/homing endonuclease
MVLTKSGKFEKVENKIKSRRQEDINEINFFSSNVNLKVTGDHKIFIKRCGVEQWVDAKEVVRGDSVMMPSIKYTPSKKFIIFQKNVTCSKKRNIKRYSVSSRVARFLGLFLGDGHVCLRRGSVFFDFGSHENHLCEFVEQVAFDIFGNSMSFIEKSENCTRCQMTNMALAKWLKSRCYDQDGNKKCPWDIDSLPRHIRVGLLSGLLESDGYVSDSSISFENSSSALTQMVMLFCLSEGITGSYSYRERENPEFIQNHRVKQRISISYKFVVHERFVGPLKEILDNQWFNISNRVEMDVLQWSLVRENKTFYYDGYVYDLSVRNDHSFCLPGCCVHNCGAGMWNIALAYKGLGLVTFSCTKSGDYLDEEVSRVTGISRSKVIKIKENKLDLNNVDMNDRVQAALSIYYDEMIERMIHYISAELVKKGSEIEGEIEIVVAGGTSLAPGFCDRLKEKVEQSDFPLKVYRVRHADSPFYSVGQGSCIRAQADYK